MEMENELVFTKEQRFSHVFIAQQFFGRICAAHSEAELQYMRAIRESNDVFDWGKILFDNSAVFTKEDLDNIRELNTKRIKNAEKSDLTEWIYTVFIENYLGGGALFCCFNGINGDTIVRGAKKLLDEAVTNKDISKEKADMVDLFVTEEGYLACNGLNGKEIFRATRPGIVTVVIGRQPEPAIMFTITMGLPQANKNPLSQLVKYTMMPSSEHE